MKKGLLILSIIMVLVLMGVYSLNETEKAPADKSKLATAAAPVQKEESEPAAPVQKEEPEPAQETAVTPAEVHFIDVGQGDCTLIDVGETEVLVDCGKADQSTKITGYLEKYVDGDLDILIATHPDEDHIGGLVGLLQYYTVDTIVDSGASKETTTYNNYRDEVERRGIHLMEDEDTAFSLGEGNSLQIIETGDGNIDANEDSVVCVFRCGNVSVLLTGDMGTETEAKNLSKFPKVDVLKAGHHGSAYSTGKALLRKTKPDYVIISAGKDNEYGHPAPQTLERIQEAGAISYSTIDQGTIIMKTDGTTISFDFTGPTMVEEPADAATYGTGESTEDPAVSITTEKAGSDAPYVGNVNSYKFHHSWCKSVKQMAEHNKVFFNTREEAVNAHFKPCKNCNP